MTLDELMQAIETHQFAAELNVVSGTSAFYRALRNHHFFGELTSTLKDRSSREALTARLLKLCNEQIDPQYENPFDTAMTIYLTALDDSDNPAALAHIADSVSKAPNCWWAAETAERILSKVKMQRQRIKLGGLDPGIRSEAPLGRMSAFGASSPPLTITSSSSGSGRFYRHRKLKRGVETAH